MHGSHGGRGRHLVRQWSGRGLACAALALPLAVASCHKGGEAAKSAATDAPGGEKAAGKGDPAKGDPAKGGHGKSGGGPVAVKVAQVERRVAPRVVYAVAALAGRDQADVYSKVLGRISFMGPKEGEPVKANQILFRVDRSDPGETYLNAPVLSPIAGWVGMWRVTNLGAQVSSADPVLTVVDDRVLKAIASLPANDWLEVTPTTRVTATVDGVERVARIDTIARSADLSSGRGSITLSMDNAKRDWRAGMYTRLKFELSPKQRILISASSLIITDSGAYVYVADADTARRVAVKFAVVDGDTVEITAGLQPENKVVTAGGNLLGDKSAIRVVD